MPKWPKYEKKEILLGIKKRQVAVMIFIKRKIKEYSCIYSENGHIAVVLVYKIMLLCFPKTNPVFPFLSFPFEIVNLLLTKMQMKPSFPYNQMYMNPFQITVCFMMYIKGHIDGQKLKWIMWSHTPPCWNICSFPQSPIIHVFPYDKILIRYFVANDFLKDEMIC